MERQKDEVATKGKRQGRRRTKGSKERDEQAGDEKRRSPYIFERWGEGESVGRGLFFSMEFLVSAHDALPLAASRHLPPVFSLRGICAKDGGNPGWELRTYRGTTGARLRITNSRGIGGSLCLPPASPFLLHRRANICADTRPHDTAIVVCVCCPRRAKMMPRKWTVMREPLSFMDQPGLPAKVLIVPSAFWGILKLNPSMSEREARKGRAGMSGRGTERMPKASAWELTSGMCATSLQCSFPSDFASFHR